MLAYRERLRGTAEAATMSLNTTTVDYGHKRVIERIVAQNKTTAAGVVSVYLSGYGYNHYVAQVTLNTTNPTVVLDKPITLREDEGLTVELSGLTVGDNIEVWLTGYEEVMT